MNQPANAPESSTSIHPHSHPHARQRKIVFLVLGLLLFWAAVSYLMMPWLWGRYIRKHPSFEDIPNVTRTKSGIDADPLNVALTGTHADMLRIMAAANWKVANPLSFKSCLEIAEATVLKRSYAEAPVSSEYLFGRKEDLAFEKPVGKDPRQRHHVRFWKTDKIDQDGRPIWIGSAIYDEHVGFSLTTGQVTHVTAPDIDTERDFLFADLKATGDLSETYVEDDYHKIRSGKNGQGHPWHTDGKLYGGVIKVE